MSALNPDHVVGASVFVACLLALVVWAKRALDRQQAQREWDEWFAAYRDFGMGDPSTVRPADWHPSAGIWSDNSATPIYDQLAAETARRAAWDIEDEWLEMNGGQS